MVSKLSDSIGITYRDATDFYETPRRDEYGVVYHEWDFGRLEGEARAEAEAAAERRRLGAAARRFAEERAKRLRDANVRLRDETHDLCIAGNLDETNAHAAVRDWMLQPTRYPWLVLSGSTGSGKTVAAADAVAGRIGAVWMRADDVVRTFAGFFGDAYERQEKTKSAYLLVLDDLGTELDKDRMLSALLELIDARVSARATRTIVTTNLSRQEFIERYPNDRLRSRMRELADWVSVTTGDLRKR